MLALFFRGSHTGVMQDAGDFDELEFFRAIAESGARALLIGRRALIILGAPVMTGDYDFWLAGDDIARFNAALAPFDLYPNHDPATARSRGRYVLENGEHVDVLVARMVSTPEGPVSFEALWERRQMVNLAPGVEVAMPSLADLIATKRFGSRPRDADDIRTLQRLIEKESKP